MKKLMPVLTMLLVITWSSARPQQAQPNSFVGAWKISEVISPNPNKAPQASLYLFTGRHYTAMNVGGTTPRDPKVDDQATDEDKFASWKPFGAHGGTYEIKGNQITLRQLIAKNPGVMAPGSFMTFDFTINKGEIRLSQTSNQITKTPNGLRVVLTRLE